MQIGFFDTPIDQLPSPRARYVGNPHVSGKAGGHTLNLRTFARNGMVLLGRVQGANGSTASIAHNLNETLTRVDEFTANLMKTTDEAIAKSGMNVPEDEATRGEELSGGPVLPEIEQLDLRSRSINSVIWAGGYNFDVSWVRLPIFDDDGYPIQVRGITKYPGLYFLGVHLLHNRKSGLFLGVGGDAAHIAEDMEARG